MSTTDVERLEERIECAMMLDHLLAAEVEDIRREAEMLGLLALLRPQLEVVRDDD
jgi:hypothetical protein